MEYGTLSLIIGLFGLASAPILFGLKKIFQSANEKFDRSKLIDGNVVEIEHTPRGTGVFPTIEYTNKGKLSSFRNSLAIPMLQVGDTLKVQITNLGQARVFNNKNTQLQTIFTTWSALSLAIGTTALGAHFLVF